MLNLFLLIFLSVVCFIVFVVFLFISTIKKNKNLKLISVALFIVFMGVGGYTIFTFFSKAIDKSAQVIESTSEYAHESIETASKAASSSHETVRETIDKAGEYFEPRNGDEIYNALFGKQDSECVTVLNYQDQIVPKIDYAILLHCETCPNELDRILNLHEFSSDTVSTEEWNSTGSNASQHWFNPALLGDFVLVFTYLKDEYGNAQYIYSSLDSSEVFVKDILD